MYLYGKPVVGAPGEVHTEKLNPVGMECEGTDENGNFGAIYRYGPGVANGVRGSWCSVDDALALTLAVANAQGDLCILTAAVDATTKYGWHCVKSNAISGKALTLFADNGKVYLTSTPGSVDDTDVAGDAVIGAIGRSAVNETTLLATFQIDRPKVQDLAID